MTANKEYIRKKILSFNKNGILKGLTSAARIDCLVNQIMDSIERVNHTTNPQNISFNPIYLAKHHNLQGNIDEACWLSFLATHFGENEKTGWSLLRNVYYALGSSPYWTWKKICSDINGFRQWIQSNKEILQASGRYGNHRKYERLLDTVPTTATYINWVGKSHSNHFNLVQSQVGAHPHILFDALYNSMKVVWRFGRTACFDYPCLLGKLRIFDIEPGHPYLQDATGPLAGAKLLFGDGSTLLLNSKLRALGLHLNMRFSQQIIEDATCNFQKSPDTFISFLPLQISSE